MISLLTFRKFVVPQTVRRVIFRCFRRGRRLLGDLLLDGRSWRWRKRRLIVNSNVVFLVKVFIGTRRYSRQRIKMFPRSSLIFQLGCVLLMVVILMNSLGKPLLDARLRRLMKFRFATRKFARQKVRGWLVIQRNGLIFVNFCFFLLFLFRNRRLIVSRVLLFVILRVRFKILTSRVILFIRALIWRIRSSR